MTISNGSAQPTVTEIFKMKMIPPVKRMTTYDLRNSKVKTHIDLLLGSFSVYQEKEV